jgi:hypothetical protein
MHKSMTFAAGLLSLPALALAQVNGTCRSGAKQDPAAVLSHAFTAMGLSDVGDRVLHMRVGLTEAAAEQSERWYPPYITAQRVVDVWVDPAHSVERTTAEVYIWPGNGGVGGPPTSTLAGATATYMTRDTLVRPVGTVAKQARYLDPWLVVTEWRTDPTLAYAGECMYRDRWRSVITRQGVNGTEKLFVDATRGFPTKVEYDDPHYLWGQTTNETIYSEWIATKGAKASYPGSVYRIQDGVPVGTLTVSGPSIAVVPRDSAPSMALPANAPDMRKVAGRGYGGGSKEPDTVRIGARTFLIVNPSYTETVTLQRDTVFLLDATIGEDRARQDSTWIAKLFPGKHAVVVVVTDLAWPHISGVRFWVARGATIVSHGESRGFLEKVTAHKWNDPDALEKSSAPRGSQMRFRAVSDSLSLAGGAIQLYPIDGIGSEGALMAYIPADGYLWASDFVQTVRAPSQYGNEVLDAAKRVNVTPAKFAAEHLPLTDWNVLVKLRQ